MSIKIGLFFFTILIFISCSEDSREHDELWNEVTKSEEPISVQVEIFSEQFKWTVRYSGKDNTLGKFDYKLRSEINPLGIVTSESINASLLDPNNSPKGIQSLSNNLTEVPTEHHPITQNYEFKQELKERKRMNRLLTQMKDKHDARIDVPAFDDVIITDTLVLCVDQAYEFHFRSNDVLHAAYFPEFRAQMNIAPGVTNHFDYTPTVTTKQMRINRKDPHFEYTLMCNKICGAGHDTMKMVVRVLGKEAFIVWMNSKSSDSFRKTNNAMKSKVK